MSKGIDFTSDWLGHLNKSDHPNWDEMVDFMTCSPAPVIFVDNTAAMNVARSYAKLLSKGISVVTPNKVAFSEELKLWEEMWGVARNGAGGGHEHGYLFHESTVAAGLPVLATLRELLDTGDEVHRIEGIFSGTLSFLFNEWDPVGAGLSAGSFSAVVRRARDLGFTEPDPRADLLGFDVARKLTILARIAGVRVENYRAFPVQGLVPESLKDVEGADAFLDRLSKFDTDMDKLRAEANESGKVLRYVGSVDVVKGELKVGLEKYHQDIVCFTQC
jgi:homoserine dehydrogenase